jgi:hypothetical protein
MNKYLEKTYYDMGLEEAAVMVDNFASLIVQEAILSSADMVAATEFQKKVMPLASMIRERKKK